MVSWSQLLSDKALMMSFFGNEYYLTGSKKYLWTRMQYKNRKDKNGKEIYEGDIVKDDEIIGNIYENPELLGDKV